MARFEVYISDEGLAEIDGEPLAPAPGQSVHEAVLDQLHRYARERGEAVEATVTERPDTGHFVLEVAGDGSSRLLTSLEEPSLHADSEPVPEYVPDPGLGPEPVPTSGRASEAEHEPAWEPDAGPEPGTAREGATSPAPAGGTVIAVAMARAATAARATTPVAVRAAAPISATALPAALAERISHMNASAKAGRLDEAYDLASQLRQKLTDEAGADHPYAVEARALEAYFAHLCGNHREAVLLALAVARIRCGIGDRKAPEDVARAVAAWQWLDDERALVVHGHELLHMLAQLSRRGPLSPVHAELTGQVRRRLEELEVFV
ncbi:hypothetical protein AB0L67_39230 [Streptomyces flaveolus]|uniref:hypothetical protein n=1 Tax=Streptomyces flaveolus TaxID=67297 RepID=UPI0034276F8E